MYRKILVPLDGSPLAEHVLPHALELAKRFDAELLVVRCLELPFPILLGLEGNLPYLDIQATERARAEEYLKTVLADLSAGQVLSRKWVADGPPVQAILEAASELGADLIVMSSHGRSGLSRWLQGSVAERVVRHARCPVMVVRAAQPPVEPPPPQPD